jgi:carbon monoxide dehydrogenase subunit G
MMQVEGSASVPAPRDRVFAMLLDPEVLKRTLTGCEDFIPTGADAFCIKMSAGIGGVRGRAEGEVLVKESRPPEHFRLAMKGKGVGSFVEGWVTIDLAEANGETQIEYRGEAALGGLITVVGNSMIDRVVRKVLRDFFERLKNEVA